MLITSVAVELWVGSLTCARAMVHVVDKDTLVIASIDEPSDILRELQPGEWRRATVLDECGQPLYTHLAATPARTPDLDLLEPACAGGDPRRV